ncbi:GNAT family N-acetyltransferase [Teichococcus wenyumeiae]|uniref:GNAT family N-acetyltransferase n=1 Tax=Teichococcus wenyumeiae TaxID=2478470 RepID=UPI00131416B0|nr:GNAT family N-acetyltransferase [Pseudoroseomonas wenyumeiae]
MLVTYLVEVAVVPAYRRRGVGGALIRSCFDAFRHTAIYADAAPDIIGLNTRYGLLPPPVTPDSLLTRSTEGQSNLTVRLSTHLRQPSSLNGTITPTYRVFFPAEE